MSDSVEHSLNQKVKIGQNLSMSQKNLQEYSQLGKSNTGFSMYCINTTWLDFGRFHTLAQAWFCIKNTMREIFILQCRKVLTVIWSSTALTVKNASFMSEKNNTTISLPRVRRLLFLGCMPSPWLYNGYGRMYQQWIRFLLG